MRRHRAVRRPRFSSLSGRRVFITGAASGIGAAVARSAARDGAVLFLTDRNAAGLTAVVDQITAAGGTV
ncbi:MAG TPA: SDR family NAD(P)-dependent oxidoreductase, partial [Jatrophihabitantaceae bacterium]|nr:SDR family NAD(P)-dependent oxidoreductase [Jatrophihabitantaceae bacterium]